MAKQSIFGRVAQLAKANINNLLDSAEDPQKMIDQLIRDYTNNIAEAEKSIAQTIGGLRMQEQDYNEDVRASNEWGQKALAASQRADQFRQQGNPNDAEKFDNLAKIAIQRQMTAEKDARAAEPNIQMQREVVEKLKNGLSTMKFKLEDLKKKRDDLVARQRNATTQAQLQNSVKAIDIMDPTSDINRFEEKVRQQEAEVRGQAEIANVSLESQFGELEDLGEQSEVEARLAELKAGSSGALTGGSAERKSIEANISPDMSEEDFDSHLADAGEETELTPEYDAAETEDVTNLDDITDAETVSKKH
ncbi:MAG: PspA/IM30 family protein [Micrococcaceae bacterium]